MKRLLSCLLIFAVVLCLTVPAAAETGFRFTRENFPVMDGSTSMVPLGQGIASVLLGESREEASDLISFNRTTQSFRNLAEGSCDIVIAAEPQSTVFDEMTQAGFSWEIEVIAREALVFVVNAGNPVDSLTVDQLRGIYSGEITSWSQVGGEDVPIEAFQRNPSSGSQVMMEKLVMGDTPMAPAPETRVPGAMGELIDAVKSYDNSASAIGYTVFYYASDMRMADGLKILKVDGVEPCAATIRSEEYPFRNEYYCCISAQAEQDSPERVLYDWLVSEQGQALLNSEGYVSAYSADEAPKDCEVYTDDSRYIPYGGDPAVYTPADGPLDALTAADRGENIYPYQGSRLYYSWDGESEDYLAGSMYGFYTHSGIQVTEPVYAGIYRETIDWTDHSAWCWTFLDSEGRWGFASRDGSFVSDLCYSYVYSIGDQLLCIRSYEDGTYELYDRDLTLAATEADFPAGCIPYQHRGGTYACMDQQSSKYCAVRNGKLLLEAAGYLYLSEGNTIITSDDQYMQQVYTMDGGLMMFGDETRFDTVYYLGGSFYLIHFLDDSVAVCSSSGSIFLENFDSCWQESDSGFRINRDGLSTCYSAQGRVLWKDIPENWTNLSGSLFSDYTGDGLTLRDTATGAELVIPNACYTFRVADRLAVSCWDEEQGWRCWWINEDLSLTDTGYAEINTMGDLCTEETVIVMSQESGVQVLMSADLTTELGRGSGDIQLQDGMVTLCSDRAFTCTAPDGTVIFRYPYYGLRSGD